jgi:hypothetical protein
MIQRNRGGVYRRTPLRSHESGNVPPTPAPTIDDLLRVNPLPPALAHLEEAVRALPDIDALVNTVFGCASAGFNDDQISAALRQVAERAAQPAQRCACCLAWRKGGRTFAQVADDVFSLVTICPVCERLIETNRVTASMQRNFRAYMMGGGA